MTEYKNILIGNNTFTPDWKISLDKINKENIIFYDFNKFNNFNNLSDILLNKNIAYILPLSDIDFNLVKIYISNLRNLSNTIKILYPTEEIFKLLDNKNDFTEFMLTNYNEYIPDIYYLNNKKLKNIEYPAISKPTYSTNASGIKIIYNDKQFLRLANYNNIQKFIEYEYEYAAYMLCIDGIIVTQKIIRFKYKKFNIKKTNFPKDYETVENLNTDIFKSIIHRLKYSGGACINFKVNEIDNKINIFEINPRFGGSAFTNDFIYELLCIL